MLNELESSSLQFVSILFELFMDVNVDDNTRRLSIINLKNIFQRKKNFEQAQQMIIEGVARIFQCGAFDSPPSLQFPFLKDFGALVKIVVSQKDFPVSILPVLVKRLSELSVPTLESLANPQLGTLPPLQSIPSAIYICHQMVRARYHRPSTAQVQIFKYMVDLMPFFNKLQEEIVNQVKTLSQHADSIFMTNPLAAGRALLVCRYLSHLTLMGCYIGSLPKYSCNPHFQQAVTLGLQTTSILMQFAPAVMKNVQVPIAMRQIVSSCLRCHLKELTLRSKLSPMAFAHFGLNNVLSLCLQIISIAKEQWHDSDRSNASPTPYCELPDSAVQYAPQLIEHCMNHLVMSGNIPGPDASKFGPQGVELIQKCHEQLKMFFSTLPSPAAIAQRLAICCLQLSPLDYKILMEDPSQSLSRPMTRQSAIDAMDIVSAGAFASDVCSSIENEMSLAFTSVAAVDDLPRILHQESILSWAAAAKRAFKDATNGANFSSRVNVLVNIIKTHNNPVIHARAAQLIKSWADAECDYETVGAAIEVASVVLQNDSDYCRDTALDVLWVLQMKQPDHPLWDLFQTQIIRTCLSFTATADVGKWAPLQLVASLMLNENSLPCSEVLLNIYKTWSHLSMNGNETATVLSKGALMNALLNSTHHIHPLESIQRFQYTLCHSNSPSTNAPSTSVEGSSLTSEFVSVASRMALESLFPLLSVTTVSVDSKEDEEESVDLQRTALSLLTALLRSAIIPEVVLSTPILGGPMNIEGVMRVDNFVDIAKLILRASSVDADVFWMMETQHLEFLIEFVSAVARATTPNNLIEATYSQLHSNYANAIANDQEIMRMSHLLSRGSHRGSTPALIQVLGRNEFLEALINAALVNLTSPNHTPASHASRLLCILLSLSDLPLHCEELLMQGCIKEMMNVLSTKAKPSNTPKYLTASLVGVLCMFHSSYLIKNVLPGQLKEIIIEIGNLSKATNVVDPFRIVYGMVVLTSSALSLQQLDAQSTSEVLQAILKAIGSLHPCLETVFGLNLIEAVIMCRVKEKGSISNVSKFSSSPLSSIHEFSIISDVSTVSQAIISKQHNVCTDVFIFGPRSVGLVEFARMVIQLLSFVSANGASLTEPLSSLEEPWRRLFEEISRGGSGFETVEAIFKVRAHTIMTHVQ